MQLVSNICVLRCRQSLLSVISFSHNHTLSISSWRSKIFVAKSSWCLYFNINLGFQMYSLFLQLVWFRWYHNLD